MSGANLRLVLSIWRWFSLSIGLVPMIIEARTILLKNANIYTVNPDQPSAEAMAIDDETGLILAVGSTDDVTVAATTTTTTSTTSDAEGHRLVVIDMGGRLVLPGFQDAHLHVVEAGINQAACEFDPEPAMGDLPLYFDDCEGTTFGDQGWLMGSGVDISYLLDRIDTAGEPYPIDVLDQVYPDTPVLILDNLGHGAIANSAALRAVGYDQLADDPPGGILVRGNETTAAAKGRLVGIALENAQQRLREAAFPPTVANRQVAYESLLEALAVLASNGITAVSDAGGFWRQAQTEAWSRAEREGTLTVRATNALYVYPDHNSEEQQDQLMQRFSDDATKLVRFNQAKIYVDGILSLGTGALKEPYIAPALPSVAQLDDLVGFEYFGDSLLNVSQTLVNQGFRLHFHVTGDRGASLALDVLEAIGTTGNGGPHRLTHCYLVDEQDRPRFAELNVFADFQVAPSSVSADYVDFLSELLGSDRSSQLIPAREVHAGGESLVVLSSDWDADELSPLAKIQTVLTRSTGTPFPSAESVIPLLTRNPAALLQTNTGSIQAGKLADVIALDQDIFNIPVESIRDAKVVFTMLHAKVIYDPTNIAGVDRGITSTAHGTIPFGHLALWHCLVLLFWI